ncbi:uncharacterized protein LOC115225578 isoform X2 [Octopus sinensis]|uniref:Uncharacterized protein LOC115225578 isoform X2 n=2 Tax=Octopus sinensis TaxID=2607531 RepID=A0A7E6FRX6_9MOLL|nr:uncharacterized protein LOC115225578 isoform X2 [Octopus sinensis]
MAVAATKPHGLMDLFNTIRTEADAVAFFAEKGIIPPKKRCKKRHFMKRKVKDRSVRWRCTRKGCDQSLSVRKGTWLEGTSLPLRTILLFLYSWVKKLTTIRYCYEELGVSHTAAVDYTSCLREVCAEDLLFNPVQIGGPGKVVEIDETVFSRRKCRLGGRPPHQWVYKGVCRKAKQVFLYTITCRDRDTLEECIRQSVLPGTTVISDLWRSYSHIPEIEGYQFRHKAEKHGALEGPWACVKQSSMIDSGLCEIMWRKRYEGCDLFEKLLAGIARF